LGRQLFERTVILKAVISIVIAGGIVAVVATAIVASHDSHVGTRRMHVSSRAGRDPPGRRWYAPNSLWNTPIAANPRIAPNNASLIAAWADTAACNFHPCLDPSGYSYTPAIYYPTRATPKVPVRIDVPRCNARTVRVPIPQGALPDPSREGHMAIAAPDGTEYDFYDAQYPGGSPKSSRYYRTPCSRVNEWTAAKVVTTNWIHGDGELRGSVRGSGTPEGAGTILPRDTQEPPNANWGHALAISYRNTCSHAMRWCPYVAPATDEDGTGSNEAEDVPEGARFQLDPSIDCGTWPSLRYVWQRQMCRTLQVYGAIIVDTNHGGMGIYVQWIGSTGGYRYPWQPRYPGFPNELLTHFRVLAWH
jgi:hypothetical protein